MSESRCTNIRIQIEVGDDGYAEATLFVDGSPLSRASDSTNTVPMRDMIGPLARVAGEVAEARRGVLVR